MFSRARSSPTSALLTPRRLYRAKTISEIGRSLKDEIAWLNNYHASVRERLAPHVAGAAAAWLVQRTEAI